LKVAAEPKRDLTAAPTTNEAIDPRFAHTPFCPPRPLSPALLGGGGRGARRREG
jgi:hypothetical protein